VPLPNGRASSSSYASGARIAAFGPESRAGSTGSGPEVRASTVIGPATANSTSSAPSPGGGTGASDIRSNAPTAASASNSSPLWNVTPSRSSKRHVRPSTASQDSASPGSNSPSKPARTSGSVTPSLVSTKASSVSTAQPRSGPNPRPTFRTRSPSDPPSNPQPAETRIASPSNTTQNHRNPDRPDKRKSATRSSYIAVIDNEFSITMIGGPFCQRFLVLIDTSGSD
jgi:hypothetical protein